MAFASEEERLKYEEEMQKYYKKINPSFKPKAAEISIQDKSTTVKANSLPAMATKLETRLLLVLGEFEAWRSHLTTLQQAALAWSTLGMAWFLPLLLWGVVKTPSWISKLRASTQQKIRYLFKGEFNYKKAPFLGALLIAYVSIALSGFLGGVKASSIFLLVCIFAGPASYFFLAKSRKWAAIILFFLIFIPGLGIRRAGVNNAPLGQQARERAAKLIVVAVEGNPEDGKRVSEEIRSFTEKESNWFVTESPEYEILQQAQATSLNSYNAYQQKLKAEQEEIAAKAAREADIKKWGPFFADFEVRQQAIKTCNDYAFKMTKQTRSWFFDDRTDFDIRVIGSRVWVGGPMTVKDKNGNIDGSDRRYQVGVDCYWDKNATSLEGGQITVE